MRPGLAAMEGCLMEGSTIARPLDYFGLLVAASVFALISAGVSTRRGCLRGPGQQPTLVVDWPPRTSCGGCCDERNLYLPRPSRATLEKMNPPLKWGIMQVQTLVCSRRP